MTLLQESVLRTPIWCCASWLWTVGRGLMLAKLQFCGKTFFITCLQAADKSRPAWCGTPGNFFDAPRCWLQATILNCSFSCWWLQWWISMAPTCLHGERLEQEFVWTDCDARHVPESWVSQGQVPQTFFVWVLGWVGILQAVPETVLRHWGVSACCCQDLSIDLFITATVLLPGHSRQCMRQCVWWPESQTHHSLWQKTEVTRLQQSLSARWGSLDSCFYVAHCLLLRFTLRLSCCQITCLNIDCFWINARWNCQKKKEMVR